MFQLNKFNRFGGCISKIEQFALWHFVENRDRKYSLYLPQLSRLGWILIYSTQIPANNVIFINEFFSWMICWPPSRPKTLFSGKSISYVKVPPSWPRGRSLIACFYPDSNGVLNGVFINKKLLYLLMEDTENKRVRLFVEAALVWRPFRNHHRYVMALIPYRWRCQWLWHFIRTLDDPQGHT